MYQRDQYNCISFKSTYSKHAFWIGFLIKRSWHILTTCISIVTYRYINNQIVQKQGFPTRGALRTRSPKTKKTISQAKVSIVHKWTMQPISWNRYPTATCWWNNPAFCYNKCQYWRCVSTQVKSLWSVNLLLKFHPATESWVAAGVYCEQLNLIRICDIANEQPDKVVPVRKYCMYNLVWLHHIAFLQLWSLLRCFKIVTEELYGFICEPYTYWRSLLRQTCGSVIGSAQACSSSMHLLLKSDVYKLKNKKWTRHRDSSSAKGWDE